MWVRRIFFIMAMAGLAALGVWSLYFRQPTPDARMACYYGAYDLSDGRFVVITPSGGVQNLRFVLMDGTTGKLRPTKASSQDIPQKFSAGPGWEGEAPIRATVTFSKCSDEKLDMTVDDSAPVTGTKRTFDITEKTFDSHGLKLAGRLVMPRLEGAIPVAVLVHGSERDSALVFNRLQYLLPASGIGVFVYDKRGTGASQGTYTQNFELLSDDAAAALTTARTLAGSLASEVGFQGGSQAGWIEPLAATKVKADFIVVGYGLAESPLAEDRDEVVEDLRRKGYDDKVIAKAREVTTATGRVIASHFTIGFEELDRVREKYSGEPWYQHAKGEFTGDILSYPNWLTKLLGPMFDVGTSWDYNPLPALNAYKGPHVWILAGRDGSAPSENTFAILRGIQKTNPQLDIVMFPTADHGITEFVEEGGVRTDTRFSEGYFQLMVDWILFKSATSNAHGPIIYEGKQLALESIPQQ